MQKFFVNVVNFVNVFLHHPLVAINVLVLVCIKEISWWFWFPHVIFIKKMLSNYHRYIKYFSELVLFWNIDFKSIWISNSQNVLEIESNEMRKSIFLDNILFWFCTSSIYIRYFHKMCINAMSNNRIEDCNVDSLSQNHWKHNKHSVAR